MKIAMTQDQYDQYTAFMLDAASWAGDLWLPLDKQPGNRQVSRTVRKALSSQPGKARRTRFSKADRFRARGLGIKLD